jgi:enoyl-CoA hydratase/carnithine racemase
VLDALERHLDELDERPDLAGLVIRSAKPGMFIAGADLKEFVGLARRAEGGNQRLLPARPAALRPACGGRLRDRRGDRRHVRRRRRGARLWCDRRVVTDSEKTAYGFPEVKLGLFPGWGGTARTPRMVGLSNAVELVTGGESIDARAASAMGLANDVVPATGRT